MFRTLGGLFAGLAPLALVGLALVPAAHADVVNISPDLDCRINSQDGDLNECLEPELRLGIRGTDAVFHRVGLLQFDVAGNVPAGATVESAELRLYLNEATTGSAAAEPIEVHQVAEAWTDDATWNTSDGVNAWNPDFTLGYESTEAADSTLIEHEAGGEWVSWDVTAVAQRWVSGTDSNHGLALRGPSASSSVTDAAFAASEDTTPALRPVLEIEYSTGCPSDPYAAAAVTSEASVTYWNDVLLNVIRAHVPSAPPAPTSISRAAAMMNTAIFDTMNSAFFAELEDNATGTPSSGAECGWEPFVVLADAEPDIDVDLAVGTAARAILLNTYPGFATQINTAFNARNGSDDDDDAEALGGFVAAQVIASRASDGSGASSYTSDPLTFGAWRPTPTLSTESFCDSDANAATPGWGGVTPFVSATGNPHRLPFPGGYTTYSAFLSSSLYATQYNEVKDLGNRIDSASTRTTDQREAAFFWANDLIGTYKPPGQLLEHTRIVVETQPAAATSGDAEDFRTEWSRQGIRVARLYALVSLGMADGAIAAWDMKFRTPIDLWRPVSAIQNGASDSNASTLADVNWQPLSIDRDGVSFSPCFPAWVSGHATFGAAWSRVLENEFDETDTNNPFPLLLTTEDPHAKKLTPPATGFAKRSFDSFAEAAEENAESRIWLGVHYRIDADGGLATGRSVADEVSENALLWGQTCAGWSCGTPIS